MPGKANFLEEVTDGNSSLACALFAGSCKSVRLSHNFIITVFLAAEHVYMACLTGCQRTGGHIKCVKVLKAKNRNKATKTENNCSECSSVPAVYELSYRPQS